MGIYYEDVNSLPPHLRQQAEAQISRQKNKKARQHILKKQQTEFDSRGEYDFYYLEIYPKIQSGFIVNCEKHRAFELLPSSEYCGLKLPAAKYTCDFFITYANGHQEAVEIKHKVIRKLQRDYIYRRRLFIEIHARPNGWGFREIITGAEEGAR